MARFKDTLTNKGSASTAQATILNLAVQGQQGYLTDQVYYPSATDYINKNLIVKVLQVPLGLMMMPGAQAYVAAYKNIIENWMQGWSGFNQTLSVESQETALGNAGEMFQTPGRVSRARSQITSTIVEKDRRPIIRFFKDYVRYLIGDPDTGHPLLTAVSNDFTDQLADMYAGCILAWEPDKTFRYVENAWMIANFYPNGEIGEDTGQRVLQQAGETRTYNLQWAGWQKVGYAVERLAQSFMDSVRVTGIDPSFQNVAVKAVDSNTASVPTGFQEQITELKGSFTRPQ